MTEISVPIPTDHDGYLRRECPTCGGQFKWHHGPISDESPSEPSPSVYYCPLCGAAADTDAWWTQEQVAYAQESATPSCCNSWNTRSPS